MKRDMELIRNMMFDTEAGTIQTQYDLLLSDASEEAAEKLDKLRFHAQLLGDAGLAVVDADLSFGTYPVSLTWAGCDFLDAIRDENLWNRTKSGASNVAGAGFGFFIELAKGYAKAELVKLGLPLG